jgi:flagellar basal-body rod protein FlgB
MTNDIFGTHLDRLSTALSRTSRRHSALTENLANLNTPGYKRKDVDFTIALDTASEKFPHLRDWKVDRSVRESDNTSMRLDGNNVDMEREVASIADTELRYQMLTDMTANYFSGLKNVIKEGR